MPDRSLRVLHVTPAYERAHAYGGPARSVSSLCQGLSRHGAEVTVLTTNANGREDLDVPLGVRTVSHGVEVWYFPRVRPRSAYRSPALAAAVRSMIGEFDLLHITGLWTHPVAAAARAAAGARVLSVISPRGMLMPWDFRHHLWKKLPYYLLHERRHLRRCAALHCTSLEEKQALSRLGFSDTAFVVPNGIDLAEFENLPHRGVLRGSLGIDGSARVLLFMGRLHAKKGIEPLLRAFEIVARAQPDVHLVLAGPDEQGYGRGLQAWAAGAGLSSRLHLLGAVSGARRLAAFSAADVFVLLSRSENFGMSVAEAMACRLPVIVTEAASLGGSVRKAAAGMVVDGSADAAVPAILSVIHDAEASRRMGDAGAQFVRTYLSADATAARMLAKYCCVLRASPAASPSPGHYVHSWH